MALTSPDSEPRLFYGPGAGVRLLVLAIACVALMTLDYRNQHLGQVRRWLAAGIHPLQQAVDAPFAASRWLGENLAARDTLLVRNREMERQLLVQAGRLQRMTALEAENARMRSLLQSSAKLSDKLVIAEILSVDTDPQRHRVVLNKGSREGAFVGEALIDAQGVVGQITRDQVTSAEALLITDPDHAVPVEVVRNGLRTIAVGTGDLTLLSLPYLARNADVKAGDELVSSGLGGTFPPGYPVGTVATVRSDTGALFLNVTARPAAALDRVRDVLLVAPQGTPPPAVAAAPADETPAPKTASAGKPGAPPRPAAPAPAATPPAKPASPQPAAPTAARKPGTPAR